MKALDAERSGPADDRRAGPGFCPHHATRAGRVDPAHARTRACRRESERVRARISATLAYAGFLKVKGELDAAGTMMGRSVRETATELGSGAGAGSLAVESSAGRARQGGSQALGEAVSRSPSHHSGTRRSRVGAGLPGCAGHDFGRAREDRRRRAACADARAHAVPEDTSCHIFGITALAIIRGALRDATVRRRNCSCRR